MQIENPLVPPQLGQPGAAPSPVANAPSVPEATKHETDRPVAASRENERAPADDSRRPRAETRARGSRLDISV